MKTLKLSIAALVFAASLQTSIAQNQKVDLTDKEIPMTFEAPEGTKVSRIGTSVYVGKDNFSLKLNKYEHPREQALKDLVASTFSFEKLMGKLEVIEQNENGFMAKTTSKSGKVKYLVRYHILIGGKTEIKIQEQSKYGSDGYSLEDMQKMWNALKGAEYQTTL
ncbi:MAG: hypothetical protein MRY83_23990 [Flavobacteriales bacterium]|nr:hypothetical protein [Flavobacteriales bacterium]